MDSIKNDINTNSLAGLGDPVQALPKPRSGRRHGLGLKTAEGRQRALIRSGRWILRYRWPLVLLLSLFCTTLELREHLGNSNGLDFLFHAEFLIYSLTIPILFGLILTLLSKAETERNKILYHQDLKQELSLQLNSIRTWDELSVYLVQYPADIAPFCKVALYLYRDLTEEFQLAQSWSIPEKKDATTPYTVDAHALEQLSGLIVLAPEKLHLSNVPDGCTIYSLPLVHGKLLVALYLLYLPHQHSLSKDNSRLLNSVAPSIALAIDFLHPSGSRLIRSEAAADEQQRLSRFLHDTLAQDLGYLLLQITHLQEESEVANSSALQRELVHLYDVTNKAYEQTRDTMASLYPYQEKDFMLTMTQRVKLDHESNGNLEISLLSQGEPHCLSPQIQRQLLAVYLEALTNCRKHTQATNFDVQLLWEPDSLMMTLADNGQGIPASTTETSGYGLQIMRQRAAELDGQLTFDSTPGHGTIITLRVPLTTNP